MSFPTTSVIDIGNRTEDPLSNGGKWTVIAWAGGGAHLVDDGSTITASSAAFCGMYWNPSAFTDCEAYATVNGTGSPSYVVYARAQTAAANGYDISTAGGNVLLQKAVAGSYSTLATLVYPTVAGDKIGISCIGTTITGYLFKASTGLWQAVGSVTDSTFASGFVALQTNLSSVGAGFSNVGGGAVISGVSPVLPRTRSRLKVF